MTLSFGKAKVYVDVEGCVDCGTRYSHAWIPARTITLTVDGGKAHEITLNRCGHCAGVPVPAPTITGPKKGRP